MAFFKSSKKEKILNVRKTIKLDINKIKARRILKNVYDSTENKYYNLPATKFTILANKQNDDFVEKYLKKIRDAKTNKEVNKISNKSRVDYIRLNKKIDE